MPLSIDINKIDISEDAKGMVKRFIDRDKVSLYPEWINCKKILTSKAAEDGVLPDKVITQFNLVNEGTCCNGTFVVINPTDAKKWRRTL